MIINKNYDFYIDIKNKYTKIYSKSINLFNYIEKNLNIPFYNIIKNKNKEIIEAFDIVQFKIIDEFNIFILNLITKLIYRKKIY